MADHAIELTNDELKLVRNALHSYLDDFGHEEADVLRMHTFDIFGRRDVSGSLSIIENPTSGERS